MSLAAAVLGGLDDYQAGRAWEPIGPSGHSTCIRQLAYRYLKVPRTDTVGTASADRGTLVHDGFTHRIRSAPDYDPAALDADVRITIPGLPRTGAADVVDYTRRICWDIKTTTARNYDYLRPRGPRDEWLGQIGLYTLGLAEQHPGPWNAGVLLIDLDTVSDGKLRHHEWVLPVDVEQAESLRARIIARHDTLTAAAAAAREGDRAAAEAFPREGGGPGRFPCDWCGWLSACWPAADGQRTPQAAVIADDPDEIGAWAARYIAARTAEADARDAKSAAAAYLRGNPGAWPAPGGGQVVVSMTSPRQRGEEPDPAAMAQALTAAGLPVPMRVPPPATPALQVKLL
jgi:hypothetical protein